MTAVPNYMHAVRMPSPDSPCTVIHVPTGVGFKRQRLRKDFVFKLVVTNE